MPLKSQNRDDLGLWLNADLDMKWHQKWQSVFIGEFRAKNNIRSVDLYSGGIFTNYILHRFLRVGLGYELFFNNTSNKDKKTEHRMMIQSVVQYPYKGFRFALRTSFMDSFYDFSDPNFGMRNRIKIDYTISKSDFRPFAFTELYHGFDHGMFHQKNRYSIGLGYNFISSQQIDLYYMIEDFSTKKFTRHVIGLGYSYSFNLK